MWMLEQNFTQQSLEDMLGVIGRKEGVNFSRHRMPSHMVAALRMRGQNMEIQSCVWGVSVQKKNIPFLKIENINVFTSDQFQPVLLPVKVIRFSRELYGSFTKPIGVIAALATKGTDGGEPQAMCRIVTCKFEKNTRYPCLRRKPMFISAVDARQWLKGGLFTKGIERFTRHQPHLKLWDMNF